MEFLTKLCLGKAQNKDFHKMFPLVINLLEPHAPMKEKYVRVTKQLL